MTDTVRGLLDHGGPLADPEFIAWLASQTQEVLEVKDMVWGRFIGGLQQGGMRECALRCVVSRRRQRRLRASR